MLRFESSGFEIVFVDPEDRAHDNASFLLAVENCQASADNFVKNCFEKLS